MNKKNKFIIPKNNFIIRYYNYFYNFLFKKINNIQLDKNENKDLVKERIKSLEHSTSLDTAWLLNLKKLYDLGKKKLDIKNYHFLDVGCGNGIPLIYAYKKLPFKSYSGIDLVSNYIDITNKNIFNSIGNNHIATFNADASEYILDDNSYFIFMYNPFDGFVMKKFIENNYENLAKNKSVIAYSFFVQLDIIKNYTQNIETIDQYSLANCYF
jgi:SAM-dependent methyltransferase